MCRRTAKEEIEAFKANVLININHLRRIITKALWEINKDDLNTTEQFGSEIATIVKERIIPLCARIDQVGKGWSCYPCV